MIDDAHAGAILAGMVQIGRTFRVAGQRSGQQSLTGTKYGFLQHLSHCDARLTELAHRLLVSAPVASRAVDALEAEGMLERHTDPADARASLISITERGREQLVASHREAVTQFANQLSEWDAADADRAIDLLHTLNEHLENVITARDAPSHLAADPGQAAHQNPTESEHIG